MVMKLHRLWRAEVYVLRLRPPWFAHTAASTIPSNLIHQALEVLHCFRGHFVQAGKTVETTMNKLALLLWLQEKIFNTMKLPTIISRAKRSTVMVAFCFASIVFMMTARGVQRGVYHQFSRIRLVPDFGLDSNALSIQAQVSCLRLLLCNMDGAMK